MHPYLYVVINTPVELSMSRNDTSKLSIFSKSTFVCVDLHHFLISGDLTMVISLEANIQTLPHPILPLSHSLLKWWCLSKQCQTIINWVSFPATIYCPNLVITAFLHGKRWAPSICTKAPQFSVTADHIG